MENITDRIQLFTQSSIKLQGEEFIVYIDPFQMKEEFHDADFIIFTHSHYDHFSIEDIEKVKKSETLFVAPRSMEEELNLGLTLIVPFLSIIPHFPFCLNGI